MKMKNADSGSRWRGLALGSGDVRALLRVLSGAAVILGASTGTALAADEVVLDKSGPHNPGPMTPTWNPILGSLLLRDSGEPPTLTVYAGTPLRPGAAIEPAKQFPEATSVTVWTATPTVDGGLVAAIVARYGYREVKHLLVRFDSAGTPVRAIDVYPYHPHALVVDEEGKIYSLGHRLDTAEEHPLVTVYSADGVVLTQFLSSRLVPDAGRALEGGPTTDGSNLLLTRGGVAVYVGDTRTLMRFDRKGTLLRQVNLGTIESVAAQAGGTDARVVDLSVGEDGQIAAAVSASGCGRILAVLNHEGTSWSVLPNDEFPGRLLDVASGDELMLLSQEGDRLTMTTRRIPK